MLWFSIWRWSLRRFTRRRRDIPRVAILKTARANNIAVFLAHSPVSDSLRPREDSAAGIIRGIARLRYPCSRRRRGEATAVRDPLHVNVRLGETAPKPDASPSDIHPGT